MVEEKLYAILQLCDSAFPTGGFSHSMGVEAATLNFYIEDTGTLKNFILCSLENTGSFCLPYVKAAYEASNDLKKLVLLDSLHNAALLNHVAHKASKQQGKSFLTTSCEVFQLHQLHPLKRLAEEQQINCHLPILFAVVCASLNIPISKVGKMFLFTSLRTIIASIVRLGKIGTIKAQQWQFEMVDCLDDIFTRNWKLLPEEACTTYPLIEVLQNTHDTMFAKLFFS